MNIESSPRVTLFAKAALGLSTVLLIVALIPYVAGEGGGEGDAGTQRKAPMVKGRVDSGTEVIALFIASSTCGASAHPNLPETLSEIRSTLASKAKSEGKRFIYVGVAVDEKPETGLEFLRPYGPFDEVMSGGSWLGTGSIDFMIRGIPGPIALPQLLVLERDVKAESKVIRVSTDRVVARKLGFNEINGFAAFLDSAAVVR